MIRRNVAGHSASQLRQQCANVDIVTQVKRLLTGQRQLSVQKVNAGGDSLAIPPKVVRWIPAHEKLCDFSRRHEVFTHSITRCQVTQDSLLSVPPTGSPRADRWTASACRCQQRRF
jgi:hypothetical protein